ncbi:Uncharacterised protein [uncultured archaeon]|nr:Uncharacterised protein [uncultured archaeon]
MKEKNYLKRIGTIAGAALVGIGLLYGACSYYNKENAHIQEEIAKVRTGEKKPFDKRIKEASQIEIQEAIMTIGKEYDIYVNNERVGEVDGKSFKIWGDEFQLKTLDEKLLASEKESKRIFAWNRQATFYGPNGNVTGHLGEERWNDMFTWGYVFHFHNAAGTEVGKSQKIGRTAVFNINDIYDSKGNIEYKIEKKFNILRDTYLITVKQGDKVIPIEQAILLTCIEDAIKDSQTSKESKKKK